VDSAAWRELELHVVRHFPEIELGTALQSASFLGNAGGFSGAVFWRIESREGAHCLRAWPPELTDLRRLQWIHQVQDHWLKAGCTVIPRLLHTHTGDSWVAWNGRFWELSTWMPGAADYWSKPWPAKLTAALGALAQIHLAACSLPGQASRTGVPTSVRERLELMNQIGAKDAAALASAVRRQAGSPLAPLASEILSLYQQFQATVARKLHAASQTHVHQQVVLRDVWHDHVLFQGDQVSGIVDFGAMRVDSVAVDISRLLGSLVEDDSAGWQLGMQAYQSIRPLPEVECQLVRVMDWSTVLLSGMNWLRWLFLLGREFDNMETIEARLGRIVRRLRNMTERHPWTAY
jgi:Ser/Thr protein kinase RdoA (MazF antagonist)